MYRGIEAPVTGLPYPINPTKLNIDLDEMFDHTRHMGVISHNGEPTVWKVIFPEGQYVPEEDPMSSSFHFMIAPYDGSFKNIEDFNPNELEPLTTTMLGLLEAYPQARSGYNIGPDHSKVAAQKWHNLHVHCYQFPDREHLNATVVQDSRQQPLAYRKLHELGWLPIDDVSQWWFDRHKDVIPGVEAVENVKWGIEGAFPKGGTTLILNENITPLQLAGTLKGVDDVYSELHRAVFSQFVTNYDTAATSKGKIQYELRSREDAQERISSFHPEEPQLARFRRALVSFSRIGRPANQVPTEDQIVIPPSYSVTLLQGSEQYGSRKFLTITPHLHSPSGNSEAEGIFPNRTTIPNTPVEQRISRAGSVVSRLSEKGLVLIH